MRRRGRVVVPRSLVTALAEGYREDRVYEWVEGHDLDGGATFVPAAYAGYRWTHLRHPSPLRYSTTHGLSAGNCLEEAVCQSLCEWVERDAWTLAEVACHWRPRALLEALTRRDPGLDFVDDLERFPCLSLRGMGAPVRGLLARFEAAGLEVVVRALVTDLALPVVLASVAEDAVPGFPQVHMGIGAHPDLRVAATRALTELAQSRCGDIQAVREDIEPKDAASGHGHTRRAAFIDRRRFVVGRSVALQDWREIEDHRHPDLFDDIELIRERLRAAGLHQVVVVDFSPPDAGLAVVRTIVPGLETWVVDHGRLGDRAAAQFRRPWPAKADA
jgi:ribosomal protein S12 methylthiotransferase accessory factor